MILIPFHTKVPSTAVNVLKKYRRYRKRYYVEKVSTVPVSVLKKYRVTVPRYFCTTVLPSSIGSNYFSFVGTSLLASTTSLAEAGTATASLHPGSTTPFEQILQRRQAVGNTESDLTGSRFELQTSRFRDERVSDSPTDRFFNTF